MVEKNPNINSLNEATLDWGAKGHTHALRKAFPLDDNNADHKVITTDFNASYSEDRGDVIEAVKSLDPYLHPKNQILLRALIKVNSIIHDVNTLVKVPGDPSIQEVSVKPLSVKEGLQIAQEMAPYLSSKTRYQVENAASKLHTVQQIKSSLTKVKTAETPEIKTEYILENLKHFIPHEKFNQIKQIVNIVKIFQTSNEMKNDLQEDNTDVHVSDTEGPIADKEQKDNEQLSDIMNMLDKFTNKKNTE